eukprot:1649372-Pyramimonas_sp.AAC.1
MVGEHAPRLIIIGNTVAEEFAAAGAQIARLTESTRTRVHRAESMPFAVRMRILQSTLETLQAEDPLLQAESPLARRRQRRSATTIVQPPAAS